jgi:hypothetical protein
LLKIHPLLELLQGLILTLFPHISLPGLTRVSLGIENPAEDVEVLIRELEKMARKTPVMKDNPFATASLKTEIEMQMEQIAHMAAQRIYGIAHSRESTSRIQ